MDANVWESRHLMVDTGLWYYGKAIAISPNHIDRISYDDSKVFVDVTKEAIQQAPEYHVPPLSPAYRDTQGFDAN